MSGQEEHCEGPTLLTLPVSAAVPAWCCAVEWLAAVLAGGWAVERSCVRACVRNIRTLPGARLRSLPAPFQVDKREREKKKKRR